MDNRLELILDKLKQKSSLKQHIYRKTLDVFNEMKVLSKEIAQELHDKMMKIDKSVEVQYYDISEFEFRLKFSGDTLIFQMHSNIVTLPLEDPINNNPYFAEHPDNGYFGSIRIYNFLSDSIKYNRLNDAGFLLARILINHENHFHIEAEEYFEHIIPKIEKNVIDKKHLKFFIESSMIHAIDNDLIAPAYKDIQIVPLSDQIENSQGKAGSKLGFQMSASK